MTEGSMRSVVPTTRRTRVTNYGDSQEVHGSGRRPLFEISKSQAYSMLVTVECAELSIPPANVGQADFRPFVHVEWGHGASTVSADFEVTFRQRIPLVASTVQVQAYIAALPLPDQIGAPAPVPPEAFAKFRGFVGEGIDGVRLFPSRWVTQVDRAAGILSEGQARLASLRAFLPPPSPASLDYLLLFDQPNAPAAGDVPVDGMPLPVASPASGGLAVLPLGETRAFARGIAWAVSSTPFVFTPDAAPVFVAAELEQ